MRRLLTGYSYAHAVQRGGTRVSPIRSLDSRSNICKVTTSAVECAEVTQSARKARAMARTTPRVEEATLVAASSVADAIVVGTPAWYAWLEQATTFAFAGVRGALHRPQGAPWADRLVLESLPQAGWAGAQRLSGQVRRSDARPAQRDCQRSRRSTPPHHQHANLPARSIRRQPSAWRHPARCPSRRCRPARSPSASPISKAARSCGSSTRRRCRRRLRATTPSCAQAIAGARWRGLQDGRRWRPRGLRPRRRRARSRAGRAARAARRTMGRDRPAAGAHGAAHGGGGSCATATTSAPPLNRVARILALGHGGQILLSHATHDLVADDLPAQTTLRALGAYPLKDLSRPEQIFQVVTPDLPADFPPLRTLDAQPARSPPAVAPLLATKLYMPLRAPAPSYRVSGWSSACARG